MVYPNHIDASGIWKLKNLHSDIADGTFPEATEGNRGIFGGGSGPITNVIDYIEVSSLGNAADFGDLAVACNGAEGISSKVRTLFTGGYEPGVQYSTRMQYITPQTQGNTTDFGDMTESGYGAGCNNDTRGVIHIGNAYPGDSSSEVMEYITFASTGDASDFGDLTGDGRYASVGFGDGKRGFFAGGRTPGLSPPIQDDIDFIYIASTGDSVDFGNLASVNHYHAGCSSKITGIIMAGGNNLGETMKLNLLSKGDAVDFNDLAVIKAAPGAVATATRAIAAGGTNPSDAVHNVIEYHDIVTGGDFVDFGNLTVARYMYGCCGATNNNAGLSDTARA